MKATGIVRKVDELGRVVLPIELRRILGIDIKDSLEIYIEGDKILLSKHRDNCYICDGIKGIKQFKGKNICKECIIEVGNV